MKSVAESSGTVVFEREGKFYIAQRPARWLSTALFVFGLLTFVFLINGILQLFVFEAGLQTAGIILFAVGTVFLFFFILLLRFRKKIRVQSPDGLPFLCILDFNSGNLLDASEKVLSPLSSVTVKRKMQIGSSSPKLILSWDKKSITIVKGNPFSGGVSAIETFLCSKGINRG